MSDDQWYQFTSLPLYSQTEILRGVLSGSGYLPSRPWRRRERALSRLRRYLEEHQAIEERFINRVTTVVGYRKRNPRKGMSA